LTVDEKVIAIDIELMNHGRVQKEDTCVTGGSGAVNPIEAPEFIPF
jgi:hypothetical protein